VEALAVLVTNNRFHPDWHRPVLDEGTLEIHIAEHAGALSKLKASANLLTGAWRNDDDTDGIRSLAARNVVIGRSRPRAWAATDGELQRENVPLRYEIMPKALRVLSMEPPPPA
jgi:diacylglycerol kinase family enzyme